VVDDEPPPIERAQREDRDYKQSQAARGQRTQMPFEQLIFDSKKQTNDKRTTNEEQTKNNQTTNKNKQW